MSATKDKSRKGSWIVKEGGKRVRVSGATTAAGAIRLARAKFKEMQDQGGIFTMPKSFRVADILREGLRDSKHHNKPTTCRADERSAKHLERLIGHISGKGLTVAVLEQYQEARKSEGAAPKTINLETDFLRHAWNVCASKGSFGEHPMPNPVRKLERLKTPKFNPRIFTADEWETILEAARAPEVDFRIPALLTLAFRLGLTKQDLGALHQRHISLKERVIRIPEGKRDPVVIPLDDECVRELGKLPATLGPVFPFHWLSHDGNARPIQRIAQATGLPVHLHGLRHNAATRLAGVNPLAAQKILRHKDLRTTQGYVHFSAEHLRGVVEEAKRKEQQG